MILRIRTTGCMRTRQSPYEIVGDCSDKGGHRYQPLDRFILPEVLARRRVMFILCVMTYVVSYKPSQFWIWINVVRFVCHKVWSDKEFVICPFLHCYFVQIALLWAIGIWIQIIINTNELVNKTRHWNQMPHRQYFLMKKMRCRQDFFVRRMCCN